MNFIKHSELNGVHAMFSPSQSSWLRYDDQTMLDRYTGKYRTALGTEIHEYAAIQINLFLKVSSARNLVSGLTTYIYTKYQGLKQEQYGMTLIKSLEYMPQEVFETVKKYINDAIGFRMTPEQPLVYSEYFFGTTDAISFRDNFLRIHDLKTGDKQARMEQLEVYAALFCLEYKFKPSDIQMELRLYQSNEIVFHNPGHEEIDPIIDKIVYSTKMLDKETK